MDFRIGTADDATTLALIFDAAGRRVPSYFWSQYAARMVSPFLNLEERKFVQTRKVNHITKIGMLQRKIVIS